MVEVRILETVNVMLGTCLVDLEVKMEYFVYEKAEDD